MPVDVSPLKPLLNGNAFVFCQSFQCVGIGVAFTQTFP